MREHLTGDILANSVRMERQQYAGSFLVVEGTTDAAFFRAYIDGEACRIIVADDKAKALEILEILNSDSFDGAVAIVDADFDRIVGSDNPPRNVFLTDQHDLDCMLLMSPALDKLVEESALASVLRSSRVDKAAS